MKIQKLKDGRLRDAGTGKVLKDAPKDMRFYKKLISTFLEFKKIAPDHPIIKNGRMEKDFKAVESVVKNAPYVPSSNEVKKAFNIISNAQGVIGAVTQHDKGSYRKYTSSMRNALHNIMGILV